MLILVGMVSDKVIGSRLRFLTLLEILTLSIEAMLDWLYKVNKFFDIMEVPEEEQVKVVLISYVEERELGGTVNKITEEHKNCSTGEFLRLQSRCNLRETDELSAARCGEPRHRSNVCPKRSTYYLIESGNNGLIIDDTFQEEDELEYAEPLDEEAKQVTYFDQRTLCSPKALVKDFKLPTEPHHSPYQIGWIKKGPTLKVIEICVISLKKKLESKILVTLVASPKEFQAERKDMGVSYALVVKDTLPPLRNFQHQIDLILGDSLPNIPHYRMSHKESEVLREKIEELLKKGLNQESVNPCAVLTLLTPEKDGS
uniref:Reverse transcriptase domain-containing protein n=1 Tax=Tanacetum cinerariifolium TaxID=118510 RepID=A0A6L2K8C3_TANCI|nr:hypothetical protein [Tanacetum cinerariifolium]